LLEIGSPGGGNPGVGFIAFFGETPPDLNGLTELDIRPELRFTHFDDFGNFDPQQQQIAWDPNEYIHLTVTDQWEVFEHFYGQGQNTEFIRYLAGFEQVLDKHIDTGKPGQLWLLPYSLEGAECRRIDSIGTCNSDANDHLLDKSDDAIEQSSGGDTSQSESLSSSWYANLINKLKR